MTKFPQKKELDKIRKKLESGLSSKMLPPNASVIDKTKYKICSLFVVYKRENNISQAKLAEKIGIDEALMSKILHYHIDEFTTDRLLRFLSEIYPDIDIKLNVA